MRALFLLPCSLLILLLTMDICLSFEEGSWTAAENPEKVVEALDEITLKTLLNARIHTLQGVCKFESKRLGRNSFSIKPGKAAWDGKPYWKQTEGVARFFVDRRAAAKLMTYEPQETKFFSSADGKQIHFIAKSSPKFGVVTPEHYLEFLPETTYGPLRKYRNSPVESGPVGRIHPAFNYRKQGQLGLPLLDPMSFFGGRGPMTWELTKMYSDALQEGKFSRERLEIIRITAKKTSDDEIYQLVLAYEMRSAGPGFNKFVTHTFSKKYGWNIVRWEERIHDMLSKYRTFSYGEYNGIYFPNEVEVHRLSRATGEKTHSDYLRIEELTLNEPIDAKKFSWQGISPENGTRIVDEIENSLYIYQDGELVAPGQYRLE